MYVLTFVIRLLYPPLPRTSPLNLDLSTLDNGDLFFLTGTTTNERVIRSFLKCPFSHIGVLFREKGILYAWEADVGQRYRKGPRVMKFDDKLKRYKGETVVGIRRLQGRRPSTENILNSISKHRHERLDDMMLAYLFCPLFERRDKVFCAELVAKTLQECFVLRYEMPQSFSPKTFTERIDTRSWCGYKKLTVYKIDK